MDVRPIKTDADYQVALQEIETLMTARNSGTPINSLCRKNRAGPQPATPRHTGHPLSSYLPGIGRYPAARMCNNVIPDNSGTPTKYLMDIHKLWVSQIYGCPKFMGVPNLWVSQIYGCPKFMGVPNLWVSQIYGCPKFMGVPNLWVSQIYGCPNLWVSQIYGCPKFMGVPNLWVSQIYGCPKFMGVPNLWVSQIYGCPKFMGVPNLWVSQIYGCPKFMGVPNLWSKRSGWVILIFVIQFLFPMWLKGYSHITVLVLVSSAPWRRGHISTSLMTKRVACSP